MKTITFKTQVWLTDCRAARGEDVTNPDNLSFTSMDMSTDGWVLVGEAEVTVTLRDQNEIIGSQVAVLREAKRRVQADAEVKINAIDGQIQSLLALPMEV